MKEYFSHDYHARNDSKMIQLIMKHGLEGVGAYWCIVEMLYESEGYIMQSECERIAFELRTQCDLIKSLIGSDLFEKDTEKFWSDSIHRRLSIRDEKSGKARESAYKRWNNKEINTDANAMRTQCDGNAIKVNKSKVKEKKQKEINTFSPSEEYKPIWDRWINYKQTQHKFEYASTDSAKTAFNELMKLCGGKVDKAVAIVDRSIASGWKGLFPLSDELNKTYNPDASVERTNEFLKGLES
jgi:hypothetical protein